MSDVTAGNTITALATLSRNGSPVNFTTATIQACVRLPGGAKIGPTITPTSGDAGADWSNGVVACIFPPVDTATWPAGAISMEIQATDAGVITTWHVPKAMNVISSVL